MQSVKLLVVCCIFFASCASSKIPLETWNGKIMQITQLSGKKVAVPADSVRIPNLEMNTSNGTFFLTGGCNRITGTIKTDKPGSISFGNAASTKMACDQMAFEESLLGALPTINGYAKKGDQLLLRKGKKTILKLKQM